MRPRLMGLGGTQGRARVRREPGQALIEMALVLMLLLVLTFGIADMGILMYRYVQASNCVREVARRMVVRDDDLWSDNYCVDAGLSAAVSYPGGYASLPAGDPVTASIELPHNWIAIGYLIPGLGPTVTIRASDTMRMEGQIQT